MSERNHGTKHNLLKASALAAAGAAALSGCAGGAEAPRPQPTVTVTVEAPPAADALHETAEADTTEELQLTPEQLTRVSDIARQTALAHIDKVEASFVDNGLDGFNFHHDSLWASHSGDSLLNKNEHYYDDVIITPTQTLDGLDVKVTRSERAYCEDEENEQTECDVPVDRWHGLTFHNPNSTIFDDSVLTIEEVREFLGDPKTVLVEAIKHDRVSNWLDSLDIKDGKAQANWSTKETVEGRLVELVNP